MKIWRDYSGKIYESGDIDGGSDFNRYESTHGDYNPDEDDEEWLKEVERKNEEYTEDEFAQALIKESYGIDENHTQVANLSTETKKIELTKKAYEDILSRLDKLEESEYHNAMAIERLEKINEYESNIDDVETKTADAMFEELGYEKMSDCEYKRIKPDRNGREVFITIDDGEVIKYIKDKNLNAGIAEWILSKELKAIHKKIEELKNENRTN